MTEVPDIGGRLGSLCPAARGQMLHPEELDGLREDPHMALPHLAQAVVDLVVAGEDSFIPGLLREVETLLDKDTPAVQEYVGFNFVGDLHSAAGARGVKAQLRRHLGPKALAWWNWAERTNARGSIERVRPGDGHEPTPPGMAGTGDSRLLANLLDHTERRTERAERAWLTGTQPPQPSRMGWVATPP